MAVLVKEPVKKELVKYARDCIGDKVPSCQAHKWACQRFLDDLKRSDIRKTLKEPFPYIWNDEEAGKIITWFSYLKHSKGILAGQYINLHISQRFTLCQLYGWRHEETGYKRFTISFKEEGRKNAKSQEEAGVLLYEISTQSTKNGEIYETYCAGTKREQSKIIFNECRNLLTGSPLRKKFKITNQAITHIKTGSFLKTLCKEDGRKGDGTNPAVLVLDEYHQHETTEFYDLALGGNSKESLLMIITTAGKDLTYPCYTQEYKYAKDLLNPDVDISNDTYFADIHEMDEGDDIGALTTWQKANPIRASYAEGIKNIREAYEIAVVIPEKMIAFMTKVLNYWVQAKQNSYMDMKKWKACQVDKLPYEIKGRPVYVGFDMSAKIDLTSVSFIIPIETDVEDDFGKKIVKYIVFSHSFIPNRQKLLERTLLDKVPYDAWERLGYLSVTDSEIVSQGAVLKYVEEFCKKNDLRIETLCFDPANASKLMLDASDEGYNVVEVYQSHKSLNESTAGFREQVYEGNIIYLYNPLLNFAMANAVVKTNNGLIKIDKDATKRKIDPVDATLCAFKLAMYHTFFSTVNAIEWLNS